ncbi:MAG: GspE/PulE family protein [Candidatus Paceibacterota bacterium]|jgi:type IV pilus assembly protein PilB
MLLLDLFVSQNKLTELEAKDILSDLSLRDDILIDDALAQKGVKTEDVVEVRSVLYGLPIFKEEISEDKELTKYISIAQSKQLLAIPLEVRDGILLVGVVDPEHANVLDSLQFLFGASHQPYKVYLITYDAYKKHFGMAVAAPVEKASLTAKVDDSLLSYVSKDAGEKDKEVSGENIDLTDIAGGIDEDLAKLPIPEIFSIILRYAIDNGASDIHIEHIGTSVRVRIRLDGQLETITTLPIKMHPMVIARVKILCLMKLDEKRKPQDGRFSTKFADHTIDYRVSTFPGYYGEKVVIRILDSYKGVRPIDTLGFSEQQMKEIRNALGRPYGMILICGPTGSGKTTTLYAMLNEIDREHRNVVSLEDPIEYNVAGMNQSQVFPEIGYTFASGLRSILRQDPDVIMVGEIRDAETAQLAIQAALTGHLVFSTIHTNTAIGVVTRLLDMGIEPYLIAPTLIATIGQRLSRRIAEGCGVPMVMNEGLTQMIQEQFKDLPDEFKSKMPLDKPLHEAKPSKEFATGMKGRVPVFEVLTFTDAIQASVLHSEGEEAIWKLARATGMITMKEDAIIKCINGLVPFTEINEL